MRRNQCQSFEFHVVRFYFHILPITSDVREMQSCNRCCFGSSGHTSFHQSMRTNERTNELTTNSEENHNENKVQQLKQHSNFSAKFLRDFGCTNYRMIRSRETIIEQIPLFQQVLEFRPIKC